MNMPSEFVDISNLKFSRSVSGCPHRWSSPWMSRNLAIDFRIEVSRSSP